MVLLNFNIVKHSVIADPKIRKIKITCSIIPKIQFVFFFFLQDSPAKIIMFPGLEKSKKTIKMVLLSLGLFIQGCF